MSYSKKNMIRTLVSLMITGTMLYATNIMKETSVGLRVHYFNYTSYSEQRASMPMIAGYPVLRASALDFGLEFKYKRHEFVFEYSAPVSMRSDGGNSLSYQNESQYTRYMLDYACHFDLFKWRRFSGKHAINAGLLYEDRTMIYLSNSYERTRDINFYIGPRFRVNYVPANTWIIQFNFDGRFYLPYLNKGVLDSYDHVGELIYSSEYYAFYYQSVFSFSLIKEFSDGNRFELGLRKNDLVGFANSRPLFYTDDLIHFKFDRLFQCYIALDFNLGGILRHED